MFYLLRYCGMSSITSRVMVKKYFWRQRYLGFESNVIL